jgi:NADPH-dependent glutamate synthase beta subunit-like oxidoreductase/dihydroorotate dehydrogenase
MRFKEKDILLPIEVAGVKFRNPLYVASGPTTMTVEQLIRIEETGWGGASLKLTFDPPPYINRYPRYGYWAEDGIFSFTTERRMAFEDMLRLLEEARKKTKNIVLFSNFTYSGDKGVEGWVNMAKKFESAGAHINEINMCCPNMSYNVGLSTTGDKKGPKTGASLGQQSDAVKAIVSAVRAETSIPLFVKLTPEGGRIAQISKVCYEAGADAVGGAANRLAIHHIDLDNPARSPISLQDEISMQCMCGRWVHPLGLRDVYEIRKLNGQDVNITGTGGVEDWQSAVEMFLCGATIVGISAETLISGFGFLPELIIGLKKWLEKHHYESTESLTNIVPPKITAAPEVTLYEGHSRIIDNELSAPCIYNCPASVPAQAYISKIADREFQEGFDILTSSTPLMSICSWICNHPCENECTRGKKDEAVRIRDLKRFLIEKGKKNNWRIKKDVEKYNGKSVAVVGAGPSGLSAAALLAKAGYKVKIYESESKAGGMLRYALPVFRIPRTLIDDEVNFIKSLGVEFEFNRTLGRNLKLKNLKDEYDAVYLAIGAQKGMSLRIENEKAKGSITAIDFLKSVATGQKIYPGKRVAVIGGGFTAIDSARTAIRLGAKEVYILYRRTKDEMPAAKEEIKEAEEEGVKIMYLVSPKKIITGNRKISSIVLINHVLGEMDSSGRRKPEEVNGTQFELKVDTVISALGQSVDLGAEKTIKITKWGTIVTDNHGLTNEKGVFSGGDAVLGSSTVIEAIGAAKNVAAYIDKMLMKSKSILKPMAEKTRVDVESVLIRKGTDERKWRVPLILVNPEKRKRNFGVYTPVLTDREAVKEASRCYRCGCGEGCMICHDICKMFAFHKDGTKVILDEDKCVACGMCIWRCPSNNIKMVKTSDKPI